MLESLSHDTTHEAALMEFSILRRMDIARRAEITFSLCETLREVVEEGVRQRHPGYNDRQIGMAVLHLKLGEKMFRELYPGERIEV